jgi:Xaa-Pro aminopeptidase
MITIRETPFDFNAGLDAIEKVGASSSGKDVQARPWAEFPAEEYARRYARLKTLMNGEGIDAALFTQEENVRYFTGYLSVLWVSRFRPLTAVIPADPSMDAGLLVSGQELPNAEATSWVEAPRRFSPQEPPMPHLAKLLQDTVGSKARVGIELGFGQRLGMSIEQLKQLESLVPDIEFVDITPLSECVRMLKSPAELDVMRQGCIISCEGVRAGWEALRPGMSERDVVAVMGKRMFELGAEVSTGKASCLAIMGGTRLLLSNAVATDKAALTTGDMVLVDGGANYKGYVTDFIRQASLGPIKPDTQHWLDVSIESNHATMDAIRPGVVASDVYDVALGVFAAYGLEKYNRMNIVGHGIGADIHELPWIGEAGVVYTSDTVLREGMVLSIEPILAAPPEGPFGRYIVENMVAITSDGTELLTGSISDGMWVV